MYRLIKYYNEYASDKANFSDCSTKYEILDTITDDCSLDNLIKLSEKYGYKRKKGRNCKAKIEQRGWNKNKIEQAIKLDEIKFIEGWNKKEVKQVYLGLIKLDTSGPLKPVDSLNNPLTDDDIYDIFNMQHYGVYEHGETVGGENILVITGWNFFHDIKMLGYSLKNLLEKSGIEDERDAIFNDSVFRCSECGEYDYNDNGYTYNYRITESCEILGLNCGCFQSYAKENFADEYGNNSDKAIELDTAETLESEGKLKHLERFIGGMTDGRGGYFNGESCDEGEPSEVLKELLEKNPDNTYIFSHDDSGQFQTYFSVWQVIES